MIREFKQSDYQEVRQWWEGHKWPAIPLSALPKTGLIVEGVCAGWLYSTDSSIAWMEWIVSNPLSDKTLRDASLNTLIENLLGKAKESGFTQVFTSVNHPKLIERYQNNGFTIEDRNVTHMIRSL